MLRTRVVTALALLPLVLGMLFFANVAWWAGFALAIVLVAGWEWSRMCGLSPFAWRAYLVASGAIGGALLTAHLRMPAVLYAQFSEAVLMAATYFWIFGAPAWLAMKLRPPPWALALCGWLVLWPMWAAMIELRSASPWLLLAVAALVWVADISAYFAGRRFGRLKLAPAISPGKTWEGVAGALLGVLVYGIALDVYAHSQPTPLTPYFGGPWGALSLLAMVGLTIVAVYGDLFESWLKRGAGMKDSSKLLPGHGGMLDRIDALTSTLPVAALLVALHRQSSA
jgi:phosphatidate cytidylyltransferase